MTTTVQEALSKVLKDMKSLSPEELRAELDKHKNGALATGLREAQDFIYGENSPLQVEKSS